MNSVEAELTTVRKQVTKLKEENKSNQELNATLGENLEKMSKKVEEMASAMALRNIGISLYFKTI